MYVRLVGRANIGQRWRAGHPDSPQSLDYYYQFAKVEELVGSEEKL
jgi:hypothetical protein